MSKHSQHLLCFACYFVFYFFFKRVTDGGKLMSLIKGQEKIFDTKGVILSYLAGTENFLNSAF